jgi:hypothetical protein
LVGTIPSPFVAPIPAAGWTLVWTVQDGITYKFPIRGTAPGWWRITPTSSSEARTTGRGQPSEYLEYLESLPRAYVLVLYRLEPFTWLCTPFNLSDAAQRGWENGEPRVLHLIRHAVEPFDLVDARLVGDLLLFHRVDDRLETREATEMCRQALGTVVGPPRSIGSGHLHAYGFIQQRIEAERRRLAEEAARLARAEAEERHQREMATTEGRLRWYLEFMGADMVGWQEAGEGYQVTWEYDGHTHSARIARDLRLDSAGICLGHRGQERRQNLSSVVAEELAMNEQLISFVDADADDLEIARLYLNVLPPVGTEVRIRGNKQEGCIGETDIITTKWIVDHHYWHIDRTWTPVPDGRGGITHGWRHVLSAFVYLKRQV